MVAYHSVFNVFADQTNTVVPATPDGSLAVSGTNVYPGRTMAALGAMYDASCHMACVDGTPTGYLTIQVSNDPNAADAVLQFTTARWVTIKTVPLDAGLFTVEVGDTPAPDGMLAFPNGARYCRIVYTNTSGTGTLKFWISGVSGI